ncbi:para-aminobenzoate synthetase/4-amino-4-deoxychorismate lyase [Melaminivora alkalimesophila]|uniref:Para-aminobenzoate synthetase/4-amino-4-deoxychorismate lyase n=2 Tax=Melaminivora alkalimesophila TaxID=1165852 RepID=A0A317RDH4_9BURK|nr:aminodeoxychorismate synthase component I [Melaminivora alkalimesophila]PWW47810.1 para-aminobenzoate synthetase/4-amino-4-deoxychorismate lyase [Melaminivora alkalimesophila]
MTDICLIDFADPRDPAGPRLRHAFGPAHATLVAQAPHEVRGVLDAVESAARAGAWVVGQLRYEAAPAFDAALHTHAADGPLAWFAVFDAPRPWDGSSEPGEAAVQWQGEIARPAFDAAIARIRGAIGAGECYQVNFTAPRTGAWQGDARVLFAALRRAQPGGYAAFLDMGLEQTLSVSPELFFDWRGGSLLARPMKGTAPRGATPAQDAAQAAQLRASPKERAENVMIVDLLRNDLSRVAEPHSVRVPRLFHTEQLPTVWQMTSDVVARTRAGTRLADVFGALFPCGSVTGAPKVRAMQLIQELEGAPRGVYCGAVGVVRPDGQGGVAATFNVPIRTVALRGAQAVCGIGSGITWGSEAGAEWREWAAKRAFVERASAPFELLETLALEAGVLRHRAEHLERMRAGATHFGYPWSGPRVEACLDVLAAAHPQGAWRARLLLDAHGVPRAEAFALQPTPTPVRLALADRPFAEAHGEFVRHKTTRRAHYAAFAPRPGSGVFDTVLYNEQGEITETTFGNLAMQIEGQWVTPPLSCGLLPGVGRAMALREGRVREAVVRLQDLPRVQGWAFVNSLRGWLAAELAPATA